VAQQERTDGQYDSGVGVGFFRCDTDLDYRQCVFKNP